MIDQIRSVFRDPQVPGMDRLYLAINDARDIDPAADFIRAYNAVMAAGDQPSQTWIGFCVQSVARLQEPPPEELFLLILEEFCDQARNLKS